MTRCADRLAQVGPTAPPLAENRSRNRDRRAAFPKSTIQVPCALLPALERDEHAGIERRALAAAHAADRARFFFAPCLRACAHPASSSRSSLLRSASVGSGPPYQLHARSKAACRRASVVISEMSADTFPPWRSSASALSARLVPGPPRPELCPGRRARNSDLRGRRRRRGAEPRISESAPACNTAGCSGS